MQINQKDMLAGAVFLGIGLFFAVHAYLTLRIGSAGAMGPGFFPLGLGLVLAAFGVVIALRSVGATPNRIGRVSIRGTVLVTLSIVFFGLSVRTLGLVPALAGATLIVATASNRTTWRGLVLVTVGMTAFCTLVFVYALGMPIPMIGPLLSGR